jgi:hypothetical protein
MEGAANASGTDKTARIEARLHALRAEMQELVAMLGSPGAVVEAPAVRPKPLRPRLVTDSRPPATQPEHKATKPEPRLALKPESKPALKPEPKIVERRQGDLFPIE